MKLTKIQWLILGFNVLIVLGFGGSYLQASNYEFVAYALSIIIIIGGLYLTLPVTKFPTYILAGVTLWGLLHMLGGSVMTPDGVLYAYKIFPIYDGGGEFYILKYDQVVHAYLYGVVGLMFRHLLLNMVGIRTHHWLIAAVAIFAAAGLSIINEIIEFSAVVMLPETGVGGYHNTVLDLVFNLGGAAIFVLCAHLVRGTKSSTDMLK